jgi:hypothetical protein
LPTQSDECHSREFIEHGFRPDKREVIVDTFALRCIPFEKSDDRAAARKPRESLKTGQR